MNLDLPIAWNPAPPIPHTEGSVMAPEHEHSDRHHFTLRSTGIGWRVEHRLYIGAGISVLVASNWRPTLRSASRKRRQLLDEWDALARYMDGDDAGPTMTPAPTPGHPPRCSCGECAFRARDTRPPAPPAWF